MQTTRSYPRMKALTVAAQSPPLRGIVCAVAGTIQFTTAGGDAITLPMVAGQSLLVEIKSVQNLGAGSYFGVWG
jgi:hypothetical protein